MIMNGELGMI